VGDGGKAVKRIAMSALVILLMIAAALVFAIGAGA
jgi:hypothetical protein